MKVSASRLFLACSGGCEGLLLATGGVMLSPAAFLLICGGLLLPLPLLLSCDSLLLLLTLLRTPPLSNTAALLVGVLGVLSVTLSVEMFTVFSSFCVSGGITGVCWGFGALSWVPWGLAVVLGELGMS